MTAKQKFRSDEQKQRHLYNDNHNNNQGLGSVTFKLPDLDPLGTIHLKKQYKYFGNHGKKVNNAFNNRIQELASQNVKFVHFLQFDGSESHYNNIISKLLKVTSLV